jgi:hypothetical protein
MSRSKGSSVKQPIFRHSSIYFRDKANFHVDIHFFLAKMLLILRRLLPIPEAWRLFFRAQCFAGKKN